MMMIDTSTKKASSTSKTDDTIKFKVIRDGKEISGIVPDNKIISI